MSNHEWFIKQKKFSEGEGTMVEGPIGKEEELVVKVEEIHMVRKSLEDQMEIITETSSIEEEDNPDIDYSEEIIPTETFADIVRESLSYTQSADADAIMRVLSLVENKMENLESKREKYRRSSSMYIVLDEQIIHWARFSASLSMLIENL